MNKGTAFVTSQTLGNTSTWLSVVMGNGEMTTLSNDKHVIRIKSDTKNNKCTSTRTLE